MVVVLLGIVGEQLVRYIHRSYDGGVNDKLFPYDIADTNATELKNADTRTPGIRKKRPGTTITATGITSGPILGLGMFYPNESVDNAQLLAVAPDGGSHARLWKWEGTGNWSTVGVLTGFTNMTLPVSMVQHYDLDVSDRHVMVLRPGSEDTNVRACYYDGSTVEQSYFGEASASPVSVHPSSPAIESAFYRLWGSGTGGARNRVQFSAVGTGNLTGAFTPTVNAYTFGGDSQGRIVALKQFRSGHLIVFMTDKIEMLVTTDKDVLSAIQTGGSIFGKWDRETIDPAVGCLARRSVQVVGPDMIFADQYGNIRSLQRTIQDAQSGTASLPLSDAIQGTIDRINKPYIDRICAIAFDRFYLVGFPVSSDTEPSEIWRYDITKGSWDGPWTGISPKVFAKGHMTNTSAAIDLARDNLYVGTNESSYGQVLRMEDGTSDFGSSIAYREESKRITFGTLELDKRWHRLVVFAKATADVTVTVEAQVDATGYQTLGTFSALGDAPVLPVDLDFTLGGQGVVETKFNLEDLLPGKDIQVRLSADTTDELQILGFTMMAFMENFEHGVVVN